MGEVGLHQEAGVQLPGGDIVGDLVEGERREFEAAGVAAVSCDRRLRPQHEDRTRGVGTELGAGQVLPACDGGVFCDHDGAVGALGAESAEVVHQPEVLTSRDCDERRCVGGVGDIVLSGNQAGDDGRAAVDGGDVELQAFVGEEALLFADLQQSEAQSGDGTDLHRLEICVG